MSYLLAPIRLGDVPRSARILGARADVFVRIAAPITTGLLSATGLVLSARGHSKAAMMFIVAGLLLSAVGAAAQVFEYEASQGGVR